MRRKYYDKRGKLYRKQTFCEKYVTEIICSSCIFTVALLFIIAIATIPPTIASVI